MRRMGLCEERQLHQKHKNISASSAVMASPKSSVLKHGSDRPWHGEVTVFEEKKANKCAGSSA
jgi:hypothetical protein